MNNDENGYYMPIYMCKLCGEILVGVKEKITDKHLAISITDAVGCLGKGAFSCVRRKTPHTCDDGSIGIADLIGIFQGRNLDKAKLNTEGKGIPYIVGASCMQNARLKCEKYCENFENETISKLGDILVSTVGTLGKVAINDIGDCVLSRHVCAVRFVPEILPEYGLLCLLASLELCIPPDDGTQTGFSRKLDCSEIEKLPLVYIVPDKQRETVEKMVLLASSFQNMKSVDKLENMPDNPIELAGWFKKRASKLIKEQNRALDEIVATIKSGWDNAPEEIIQLMLEDIKT